MKTKTLIKGKSRQLFNKFGLMNVTLREVAEQLNKSYGNITYHYATKEVLLSALFEDMNKELSVLQKPPKAENLLSYFLLVPQISFDITLKYLFLTIDLNEIKRNYPDFFSRVNNLNEARKIKWFGLLLQLLEEGYLKNDIEEDDLSYIMFLSSSVRTTYFQFTEIQQYNKVDFVNTVNLLLKPYLSEKGLKVYRKIAL